jgi:hypothetical protein
MRNTTTPHKMPPRITNPAEPPVAAEMTIQMTADINADKALLEIMLTATL